MVGTVMEGAEDDDTGEIGEGDTPEENDGDAAEPSTSKQEGPTASDGAGNTRYSLQPNRIRNYANRLANQMDNPESSQSYDTQFLQQADYLADE
jgi:hypothetical protein